MSWRVCNSGTDVCDVIFSCCQRETRFTPQKSRFFGGFFFFSCKNILTYNLKFSRNFSNVLSPLHMEFHWPWESLLAPWLFLLLTCYQVQRAVRGTWLQSCLWYVFPVARKPKWLTPRTLPRGAPTSLPRRAAGLICKPHFITVTSHFMDSVMHKDALCSDSFKLPSSQARPEGSAGLSGSRRLPAWAVKCWAAT